MICLCTASHRTAFLKECFVQLNIHGKPYRKNLTNERVSTDCHLECLDWANRSTLLTQHAEVKGNAKWITGCKWGVCKFLRKVKYKRVIIWSCLKGNPSFCCNNRFFFKENTCIFPSLNNPEWMSVFWRWKLGGGGKELFCERHLKKLHQFE